MTFNFDSIAEGAAAPKIAQLGGIHRTTFAPFLSEFYHDASGARQKGLPDFLIRRPGCFTFVDTKDGVLSSRHYTQASSLEALRAEYTSLLYRFPSDSMTHSALSKALYESGFAGQSAARSHGFNHQLWKLLALQAQHGWQRFLVVFKSSPSKVNAKRYIDAGLVFCTVKTLPDLMNSIELLQRGWVVPFTFKGPGYHYTVTPDPASRGLSPDAVEAIDRAKFLGAVDADTDARNAAWTQEPF